MYAVYVDDELLYSTAPGENQFIINPKISLERNKPGLFSFTLPPGNLLYDGIQKLKSTIAVMQDSDEIFRGRVSSDETDIYGQKNVECECELAYFKDSIQRPYKFDGTPLGLFRLLIDNHNAMVNEDQQFLIGTVTAISDSGKAQVETDEYGDTFSELTNRMISAYGGLLRVRHAGGVRYIDYLADGDENSQIIEFGVNLLDLKKNISAEEVFNVLIPLGAAVNGSSGRYQEALTIKDVNGGLDYIEDAAAIAKYGKRIFKFKQWPYIEDAQELLEKGREYLATGISEETTLTVNAIDMHFVDATKQRIGIGGRVRIVSNPLGIDRTETCTKIQMDMLNPEYTQYTFGTPPLTLTDNLVLVKKRTGGGGGGGKTIKEEISDVKRWAGINISEAEGKIDLIAEEVWYFAGEINTNRTQIAQNAEAISLRATTDYVEEVVTDLTVSIEGIRGQIQLGDQIMAELALTIEGLDNWVTDADGNVSELTNVVRGLQSTVTTVDGKIVTLSNTADGFRSTIMEQGITLSELKTVNDQISATMKDVEGDIGSLVVTSDAVTAKVQTADNRVAALAITADGLTNTIAVQGVELAALKTRIDEISASVTDGNNAAAKLLIQANRIMQKVTDIQDGTMASLEILDDRITLEVKNLKDDTSASFEVMADSINAKVAKETVISEINQTAETIKISASKINLEGYVTASQLSAVEASVSNLTSGLATATAIKALSVNGNTLVANTSISTPSMQFNGNLVSQRNVTMGSITTVGKALSTGGALDLSHSHAVTVNDDGTVTLGEVSAKGGNFKIADTKVYKDGVSAAYKEGWNECRSAQVARSCIYPFTEVNDLCYANGQPAGTVYRGSKVTLYTKPSAK